MLYLGSFFILCWLASADDAASPKHCCCLQFPFQFHISPHLSHTLLLTDPLAAARIPGSGANYCESTVDAAANLDEVIGTLVKNFGEGSDYFKVLVNVFQSVLLTAEHDHLKNFYMIGECDVH